ncbi:MAG: succinylglutamate desuccinylase/aspartoacylase family protein [Spirochaetales bacterium]|nr:succinylglutamate desuccinylase/aspartoacylase family protein [Spirochaetales bacterium]
MLLFVTSCKKTESVSEVRSEESVSAAQTSSISVDISVAETPAEDSDASDKTVEDDGYQHVIVAGTEVRWDGYRAIEPESNLDIRNMGFSDFGSFFTKQYPVTRDSYKLMEGEITETEVVHIHSATLGSVIYIVGGVHGDERAAWYSALLMREATISCGDLYVLAPANANGARNFTRYVVGHEDLNRSFPGNPDGDDAEKLAFAIYQDIKEKRPDFVFDLHEAILMNESRDFLGSTYIFTELDGMEDLFFDLLVATESGAICHNEFGFTGPGPAGSVNAEVTKHLHIPTITVETFRGFDIYRRVYDQLDTIQFVLDFYGMR